MILPGFTSDSPVSILIEPNVSLSKIAFNSVYRLRLSPLLNHSGCHVCEIPLSIPTRDGFYTSKVYLQCSHALRESEVILGSDWISTCSVAFCKDGSGVEDPIDAVVSSLPPGHYWSPNDGTSTIYQPFCWLTRFLQIRTSLITILLILILRCPN